MKSFTFTLFSLLLGFIKSISFFPCNTTYFNQNYQKDLKNSFLNQENCAPKTNFKLERKVYVLNIANKNLQQSVQDYDFTYLSLAKAFETETRLLCSNMISSLEIILETGDHIIKQYDFESIEEQFFRHIFVNIIISGNYSNVYIKTNQFYIFINSHFLIKNVFFFGNDLNYMSDNNNDECYNTSFCCRVDDFNSNKSQCSPALNSISTIPKNNNYGLLNIEYLIGNSLGVQPNLTLKNCVFNNFFTLNINGFLTIFSFAPLTGVFLLDSLIFDKCFFPQSLVYYTNSEFDYIYSGFSIDNVPKSYLLNFIESMDFKNLTIVSYNIYPVNSLGINFFIFSINYFSGNINFVDSIIESIYYISSIFQVQNQGLNATFLISRTSIINITQSSVLLASSIHDFTISDLFLSYFSNNNKHVFVCEFIGSINIIRTKFQNFLLINSAKIFQNKNSFISINDSFILNSQFENFLLQENNLLIIGNTTFSNISFKKTLLFVSNSEGFIIENSYFSKIVGNIYLFILYDSQYLIISNSILEGILIYSLFYIQNSNLNFWEKSILRNSYFSYIWEKDTTCMNVLTSSTEIFNNTIEISFYRDLSIPKVSFIIRNVYVALNNFTQRSSGGIIQMQTGFCTFDHAIFTDNYFLNFNKFQFLFEYDVDCNMVVRNSIFIDNGIITKKTSYPAFHYNDVFSLWTVVYTHFNNSLFMVTDKVEMLAGFISSSPHGGVFEFYNCLIIFQITNTYFEYKGIQLDHFKSASFQNNSFYNLQCNGRSFANQYGGISLLASTSYIFSKGQNNFWVYMKNNIFYNSSCINGGGLSIVGIMNVTIIDCKFYRSRSKNRGGALILVGGENFSLKDIIIDDAEALEAGGIYMQNIISLNFDNVTLKNVYSAKNSIFYIKNIGILTATFIKTSNTLTKTKGGVFMIYRSQVIISQGIFFNSSALIEGGLMVCYDRSEINFHDLIISFCFSKQAGVFSISGSINLIFSNILIKNSSSISDSSAFLLKSYSKSIIQNLTIINAFSSNGFGAILILNDDDRSSLNISKFNCFYCSALDGSALMFSSSSFLVLENIFFENCENRTLNLKGLIKVSIIMKNINVFLCVSSNNILQIANIEIVIENLKFITNYAETNLVNGVSIILRLSDGFFMDNSNSSLFFLEGSTVNFQNVKANGQKKSIIFLRCISSSVFFNFVSFYESYTSEDNGLFSFSNSNFSAQNSEFFNNSGLVFYFVNNLHILITNCSFINNTNENSLSPNDISIDNYVNSSSLINLNSNFFQVTRGFSCFFSKNSITIITFSKFVNEKKNINNIISALKIYSNSNISIENCSFVNFTSSALFISTTINTILSITDSSFSFNKALKGSSIYLEGNIAIINIVNCFFFNNEAILSLENQNILQGVGSCLFFKPSSLFSSIFSVYSSKFFNNTAQFLAPTIFSQTPIAIDESNIFLDNSDKFNFTKRGFAFPLKIKLFSGWSEEIFTSYSNISSDNIVIEFNSGSGLKLEFLVQDFFNQTLVFDNTSVFTIKKTIFSSVMDSLYIENYVSKAMNGKVFFPNLIIKAPQNHSFILEITGIFSEFDKDTLFQEISSNINFKVRSCRVGEIILNDNSCRKCQENTYSLQNPMTNLQKYQKCNICPKFSYCAGGDLITPIFGYYRYLNISIAVIPCLQPEACLGSSNFSNLDIIECDNVSNCLKKKDYETHGECEKGNYGLLCSNCELSYGRYEKNDICMKCSIINQFIVLRLFGYMILVLVTIFINTSSVEKYGKPQKLNDLKDLYSKILINHSQQINILLLSEFQLPSFDMTKWFMVIDYISFTNDQVLNNECLLQEFSSETEFFYISKIITNTCLPFVLACICLIFRYIFFCFAKFFFRKHKILSSDSKFLLYLIISIFIFYPLVIKSCFEMFDCIQLDPNLKSTFLKIHLTQECWTTSHYKKIASTAIPGISIWGIGFPYFLARMLKKNKKILEFPSMFSITKKKRQTFTNNLLHNSLERRRTEKLETKNMMDLIKKNHELSFFIRGYKSKFYYWESLIIVRKFLLCLMITINDALSQEKKWMVIVSILFGFLYFTLSKKPYNTAKANYLENFSLVCCVFSSVVCLILASNSAEKFKNALSIFTIILNSIFFIFAFGILGYYYAIGFLTFYKSMRNEINKKIEALGKKLSFRKLLKKENI